MYEIDYLIFGVIGFFVIINLICYFLMILFIFWFIIYSYEMMMDCWKENFV